MQIIYHPSPNHDARDTVSPHILVLHYTGMTDGQAAIDLLCSPQSRVSSHYVVEEDGRVFGLVPENMRAWHAGASQWRGDTGLNSVSLGIEIVNPGHEWGYRPFPEAQMAAVRDLCLDIMTRHRIAARDIIGHSDIAPLRKADPGELFDWPYLARSGVGVLPPLPLPDTRATLDIAAEGAAVSELQTKLQRYGYGLPVTGVYDNLTFAVVRAFQRHFHPTNPSGIADGATQSVLDQLLAGV